MDGISCDQCGKGLLIQEDVRYEVRIEVKAAYDPMEITREDLEQDHAAMMKDLKEQMKDLTEKEAMDQIYRKFRFDLCPPCQQRYLAKPLPSSSEPPDPPR